jgi:hypothetical protein
MEKYKKYKKKGSILILTIMAILVLSVMVTGLLNVGNTELHTTQNYQMTKSAFYTAVEGVEDVRNLIYNAPDAISVSQIVKSSSQTLVNDGGLQYSYITGTPKDFELGGAGVPLKQFLGFEAPTLQSISLGSSSSISSIVWKVDVTSNISYAKKNAYAEVIAGVYSVVVVGY